VISGNPNFCEISLYQINERKNIQTEILDYKFPDDGEIFSKWDESDKEENKVWVW
jgi:hypothetical protein